MWSPSETREVRISPVGWRSAISFLRLALDAARFFVLPLHLFGPLSGALGQRRLPWSSDGVLLGVRSRQQDVEKGTKGGWDDPCAPAPRTLRMCSMDGRSGDHPTHPSQQELRLCWVTFLNILNSLAERGKGTVSVYLPLSMGLIRFLFSSSATFCPVGFTMSACAIGWHALRDRAKPHSVSKPPAGQRHDLTPDLIH